MLLPPERPAPGASFADPSVTGHNPSAHQPPGYAGLTLSPMITAPPVAPEVSPPREGVAVC